MDTQAVRKGVSHEFTSDWWTHNIPNWLKFAGHLRDSPVGMLEVGSYEGRSSVWFLDNLMGDPDSFLTCVDPWGLNPGGGKEDDATDETERRFDHNVTLTGKKYQCRKIKGFSYNALPTLMQNTYDVVYIDGDHNGEAVLEDAVLAWRLLKAGGLMVFDDYGLVDGKLRNLPREGVDAFLRLWGHRVELLHAGWQMFVRKIR